MARGIRFRGADGGAAVVEEGHNDPLDAGFAAVLLAIAIEILPNVVADGCEGADVASVDGVVVFSCGERDDAGQS